MPDCPICGSPRLRRRFGVNAEGTEQGVNAASFRPSASKYGEAAATVMLCEVCGHGAVDPMPEPTAVERAYLDAVDEVTRREEEGQVRTADRGLARLEQWVAPGRLLDVGCWTGSFLVAARERGWKTLGVEPSAWAAHQARARGVTVVQGTLEDLEEPKGSFEAIAMCDVLEHLGDPARTLQVVADLLTPGGGLYLTVPDAGSVLSRVLGRRWWSVLPMHLQYFTRTSVTVLLARVGFGVAHIGTHPKSFSAEYYAERLGGYSQAVGRSAVGLLRRAGVDGRLVAPDFRDRMEIIAVRR